MAQEKDLTIVTVTRNAAETLEPTIRSVTEQSVFGPQVEYLLIDGASTDGTMDIVRSHAEAFDRVVSEPDRGIFDAMNKAIRLAAGRWIVFMNAGDTFYDDETIASLALHQQSDDHIIYGDCEMVTSAGSRVERARPFWTNSDKCSGLGFCHQATYVPTQWMQEMPFDTQHYQYCCDYDFFYRQWQSGKPFQYVNRPLCRFEWGSGFSSQPRNARAVLNENARIAHCTYGYWHLRHLWRQWKAQMWPDAHR